MQLRAPAAILAGTVLAVLLLRLTFVRSDADSHLARRTWAGHPAVLTTTTMREVGLAAAAGANPSAATLQQLQSLVNKAPLSPEPFLVEGALAEKRGDLTRANQLYREARRRDPRSVAAHYLLTDLYLRTGCTEDGFRELAELSRLVPTATIQLAPAIAKFSHASGAADQLRRMFRSNSQLEQPVLAVLAQDPANADLILSVATETRTASGPAPAWQETLLDGMVTRGQYPKAFAVWSRLVGSNNTKGRGLFNPSFQPNNDPPPFNWSFSATDAGVAEPENGGLRILFYGRENARLAKQTLLLAPGRYRLAMQVTMDSGDARALGWSIQCLPSKTKILDLPLSRTGGSGTAADEFEVPAQACAAQQIELDGASEDSPATVDVRIGPLTLQRTGA